MAPKAWEEGKIANKTCLTRGKKEKALSREAVALDMCDLASLHLLSTKVRVSIAWGKVQLC